jgi:toxin ParE1/3/4
VKRQVHRHPIALLDLDHAADYYQRQGGPQLAIHFLGDAEAVCQHLAGMPGMGAKYTSPDPLFAELRFFPLGHFSKHLVFYRPADDGIEILRVLHSSRDIPALLRGEVETDQDTE